MCDGKFKVDDEAGMVAVYQTQEDGKLTIAWGEFSVRAKLLGYFEAGAGQAKGIPTFHEMLKTGLHEELAKKAA